jgi:hypothetical protein
MFKLKEENTKEEEPLQSLNGNIGFSGSPVKMRAEYQKDTENEEEKRPSIK